MRFDILTIFPDLIYQYAAESILKRAQKAGLIEIYAHNFRDFTADKQRHVDDRPYGGGPGMILSVQPIYDCLKKMGLAKKGKKIKKKNTKVVMLDPAGKKFNQRLAEKYAKLDRLVLICGRYEGFDERIYKFADEKISMGDYVLSGGELPALAAVEAVSRLIPGVLGNPESLSGETHGNKNIDSAVEPPQYTRPESFMGLKVPKILLSGDHQKIAEWRAKHANSAKK